MGKTELCYYLFLVLVVAELCLQPVAAGSTVKFLPGFQGPLPFELETGWEVKLEIISVHFEVKS